MCDPPCRRAEPRAVSLREEFPGAFDALVLGALGTDVGFRVEREHLRYTGDRLPMATDARLVLVPARGVVPGSVRLRLDGTDLPAFTADPTLGGLPVASCPFLATTFVGDHVLSVLRAGGLDVANRTAKSRAALDRDKLEDLLFVVDVAIG